LVPKMAITITNTINSCQILTLANIVFLSSGCCPFIHKGFCPFLDEG
jgi:hypothetical protein